MNKRSVWSKFSLSSLQRRLSELLNRDFWARFGIERLRWVARRYNCEVISAPILLDSSKYPHWRQIEDKALFNEILREKYGGPDFVRCHMLFTQSRRIIRNQVPGDWTEVGVFRGQSAKILLYACEDRTLHLFDTFEGQPPNVDIEKDGTAYEAHLEQNLLTETRLEYVAEQLEHRSNVVFHKGYFPDTAKGLEDKRFALVHLDGDQFQTIKDGCEFFFPRLSPGGCLIVHDYGIYQGVKQAVDEYFCQRPEVVVEIADGAGSVMVVKDYEPDHQG